MINSLCPERDRLLELARTAFLRHHELALGASKLTEEQHDEFVVAQNAVSRAFADATKSLDAYKTHVQDHRCQGAEPELVMAANVG